MSSFIKEDAVFQKENKINMQSSYGTAEIHQQHFMADDSCPSTATAFSLSNSISHNKQNHLLHHYHHPHHQYQQQQQQHITQQLFQHPHHFQAFQQQQQQRLHHNLCLGHEEVVIETVGDCGPPTLPFFTVNFKLGLNENNGNIRERVSNNEEEEEENGCLVRGNEQHNIPEGRPNSLVMQHCWPPQEDSAIKEPLWKPLSTELFIRDNKRPNEREQEEEAPDHGNRNKYSSKFSDHVNGNLNHQGKGILLEKKYRHFGELEAIYGPTRMGEETNQTGTGSVLTAENSPPNASLQLPMSFDHPQCLNVTAAGADNAALVGVYNGSETSIGEEASLLKKSTQKKKRKRKMREKLCSMALFFERLVKQLMDHQEGLHEKFLGVIGKMDQERMKREEEWRRGEAEKYNREAIARAHEQALSSCREAAIVSCLEKITGQSINLPSRATQLQLENVIPEEPIKELRHIDAQNINSLNINANNRWPKAEVEALIRVRSILELKFQEPGLKGPLWEEISTSMASMGYSRSAKRCKEKWENINKYFRKTKESAKKRSQVSKTCPYFEQLDQLYYSSPLIVPGSSTTPSSIANDVVGVQMRSNSELLEAIIARNELEISPNNPSIGNFKVAEMGRLNKLDFDGIVDEEMELQQGSNGKQKEYHDEDSKDNEEDEEEEEDDDEEEEKEDGGDGGGD